MEAGTLPAYHNLTCFKVRLLLASLDTRPTIQL